MACSWRLGAAQHGGLALALDRHCRFAVRDGRHGDTGEFEQGGHQIGDMCELCSKLAASGQFRGPRHDAGHTPPTGAGLRLVSWKRRVAQLRPTHRVQRVDAATADPLFLGQFMRDWQRSKPGKAPIEVDRALHATRMGASVIGRDHEDGVVELTHVAQQIDQAADVLVHAFEHRCISLHVTLVERTLVGWQAVPGRHTGLTRRQLGSGWHQS